MTVRVPHLGRVVLGLVVVGLVVAGLSVEAVTRSAVSRARRVLPDALGRVLAPDDAGPAAAETLAAARRHLRASRPATAARSLEDLAAQAPTPDLHRVTSLAWTAAGDSMAAARHAQLAARLAPSDADLAIQAERALDLVLAWRARPIARVLGAAGALALLLMLARHGAQRRERRRLAAFLDDVRARVLFHVDGESSAHAARVHPESESVAVDVFLGSRYGMAHPRRPSRAPTLHLAFSHAGSSRTVRLRPIRHLHDSAVRIPLRPSTLEALRGTPGRWRLNVMLAHRPVASAEIEVQAAGRLAPLRRHGIQA